MKGKARNVNLWNLNRTLLEDNVLVISLRWFGCCDVIIRRAESVTIDAARRQIGHKNICMEIMQD